MRKFEQGQKLSARSICDHNCIFTGRIVKRTKTTATVEMDDGTKRRKIYLDSEGNEMLFPRGQYSMAPIFRA